MPLREIVGFHQDEEAHWVADLECGHPQHVRHNPPHEEREWVTTSEGRQSFVGTELECLYCRMPILPVDMEPYKRTVDFDENTAPNALRKDHMTKNEIWGRIVVTEGALLYTIGDESWVLRPDVHGIVEPGVPHHVEPRGPVCFHVEFLKAKED